jgi:ABC-type dipeptide/oligopeptide/nickel transport system permease component
VRNEGWDRVLDIAWHLILPAATLSLFYMAIYTRLMIQPLLILRYIREHLPQNPLH